MKISSKFLAHEFAKTRSLAESFSLSSHHCISLTMKPKTLRRFARKPHLTLSKESKKHARIRKSKNEFRELKECRQRCRRIRSSNDFFGRERKRRIWICLGVERFSYRQCIKTAFDGKWSLEKRKHRNRNKHPTFLFLPLVCEQHGEIDGRVRGWNWNTRVRIYFFLFSKFPNWFIK